MAIPTTAFAATVDPLFVGGPCTGLATPADRISVEAGLAAGLGISVAPLRGFGGCKSVFTGGISATLAFAASPGVAVRGPEDGIDFAVVGKSDLGTASGASFVGTGGTASAKWS